MNNHKHVFDSAIGNPVAYQYSEGNKTGAVTLFCECNKHYTFSPFCDNHLIIKMDRRAESKWKSFTWEEYIRLNPADQGYVWFMQPQIMHHDERGNPYPDYTPESTLWEQGYWDARKESNHG